MLRQYVYRALALCAGLLCAFTLGAQWISASSASSIYLPTIADGRVRDTTIGSPMTADEQFAVLTAVRDELTQAIGGENYDWVTSDPAADLEDVAANLLAMPDIVTTMLNPVSAELYIVMRDGTSFTVVNNREPRVESATNRLVQEREMVSAESPAIPTAKKAVVVAYDGGADVAATVRRMLNVKGYDTSLSGASLNAMRNYKNLGVLHLDTHGASFQRVAKVDSSRLKWGDITYGLQTSTEVTTFGLGQWKDELERGDLAIMLTNKRAQNVPDGNGGTKSETYWEVNVAVTESFIAKNWSFDDGFVMLHSCYGGSGPFNPIVKCNGLCDPTDPDVHDPTPLRNAMIAAGAKTIVSFDDEVNTTLSKPAILYLFDRLLGANDYETQSPDQRPFPLSDVRAEMKKNGDLQVRAPRLPLSKSVNVTFTGELNHTILAPSIERVEITDHTTANTIDVTLHGSFGSTRGTVAIGGRAATIKSWSRTNVVLTIPPEGIATVGDIVVKSPAGIESNSVPLTEWSGSVQLIRHAGIGTLRSEINALVRFKGDIHPYRSEIDSDPIRPKLTTYINSSVESTTQGFGNHRDLIDDTTTTFSGMSVQTVASQAFIDAAILAGGGGNKWSNFTGQVGGLLEVDTSAKSAELCLYMLGYHNRRSFSGSGGDSGELPFSVSIIDAPQIGSHQRGLLPCFALEMQNDYTLTGGTWQWSEGDVTLNIIISDLEADGIPRADHPSR